MTSRERFLSAMQNHVPDRVPVTPDISNYIPAGRTGLPFWEVYFTPNHPLWQAYIEAATHFRLDMWVGSCMHVPAHYDIPVTSTTEIVDFPGRDAKLRRTTWTTPDGELTQEDICFRHEPPTHISRAIKNLEQEWGKYRWLLGEPTELDMETIGSIRARTESLNQAFGLGVSYPGFQSWEGAVEGSIQTLTYTEADHPEILEEWHELSLARGTRLVELFLRTKPDYLGLGGSGTLTLASPELARKYALPAIRLWSR
ncbi:MAG: hypothetical protein E4H09_01525, partial [Spirochaetales bacterium]